MLDFKNISVHYGLQDVLTNVSFRVNKGERVGVVGPNGSGKSTLFKIILGEMSTDHGELVIEEKPRIGSTRQHPEPDTPEETLLEYSMRGIPGFNDEKFLADARARILKAARDAASAHKGETPRIKKAVRDATGKFIWERCHRRPVIMPVIMEV